MTDTRPRATDSDAPDAIWPADPGALEAPAGGEVPPRETDGRRLRRALNREAVVDALLDLYSEGNLRPSTDEIAERAGISPRSLFRYFRDADDLAGEAVTRQLGRAMPLLPLGVGADAPFDARVAALADQRLRLFSTVGQAAHVSRLRAPFQPRLAANLAEVRRFLRGQVRTLFATELTSMSVADADVALSGADVLASFESYQLLTGDQGLDLGEARTVLIAALGSLLAPGSAR
jgi:TetR/AcrR family transcriptional regulator of autoinduction and epiphytic fitness